MSAAAARRRKQQLAAQKGDPVEIKLKALLDSSDDDEATAYEALQLAQSQVRKNVNSLKFAEASELAYVSAISLLKKNKASVSSQLLDLLVDVLIETHTEVTDTWVERISELNVFHQKALESLAVVEKNRLLRVHREFLRKCVSWSSDLGNTRLGNFRLLEILGDHCWNVPPKDDEDGEDRYSIYCDAVQSMCLAEKPLKIAEWLQSLPKATSEQAKFGHTCPPADRDALLTRAALMFMAMENLRDANTLIRSAMKDVSDMSQLTQSYMKKDDGLAPTHIVFCCILLSICEKDTRTGPLFSWAIKTFKREVDAMVKPQTVHSLLTKIGKVYFNIEPPPSMMSMMESMLSGGGMGGINPAMMQAAMSQMQGR
jgi:golgi to ER traffic protein 4